MITDAQMYSEVFKLLSYMDKKDVMKIPLDILEFIKKEKSKEYKTKIDKNDPFNPHNIDQRTIDLITWFNISYIASEEEKENLIAICKENDRKRMAEKIDYSIPVEIKNKQIENKQKITEESKINIIKSKENIFSKVIKFIKNIFLN